MNEHDAYAFEEVCRTFEAGDDLEALQRLRELARRVEDQWDRAWLIYQEIRFLVDMHEASEARLRLGTLKKMLDRLVNVNAPADSSELDPHVTLPMLAHHAEIRVTTEEGKETEALHLIEGFKSHYPKQLALPQFKALADEVATLYGFLLANAGRWREARRILEDVIPPEASRSQRAFYLGRCYYEEKSYEQAKIRLLEAISQGLDTAVEGRAHYVLGLVEYHLSEMNAAKQQFELAVKMADPTYLGDEVWRWLETTSRALGLQEDAAKYQSIRVSSSGGSKQN